MKKYYSRRFGGLLNSSCTALRLYYERVLLFVGHTFHRDNP